MSEPEDWELAPDPQMSEDGPNEIFYKDICFKVVLEFEVTVDDPGDMWNPPYSELADEGVVVSIECDECSEKVLKLLTEQTEVGPLIEEKTSCEINENTKFIGEEL